MDREISPGLGLEIHRRTLLGGVTALIVARPLVLGEDPGLLVYRLSDSSNLWLTFLWLFVGLGWAVWRVWSGHAKWHGSLIEGGLLLVIGLLFLSAFWDASYRRPAVLISWEWLVLLVVFCLVRQLARTPGENQRLLAALLASGISLSVYAIYQYSVEIPDLRNYLLSQKEIVSEQLADQGISLAEDDPKLAAWTKRIQEDNVFATYAHPNSFAGFLVLLFPGAAGAAVICRNRDGWCWKSVLAVVCLVIMATSLWLTHSRGAILGCILIAAAVLFARLHGWAKVAVGLAVALGAVLAGLAIWKSDLGGVDLARKSLEKRLDYWQATWAMITDGRYPGHFWLGVGPGNFNRFYPRYMSPTAHEEVTDPHNFVLETWATSGVFVMLALGGVLAGFFWQTRQVWSQKMDSVEAGIAGRYVDHDTENRFGTRWEFYLGGIGGLLLGFILAKFDTFSDPNLTWDKFRLELVGNCVRSFIWFAAFALMETVAWTRALTRLVLTAGLGALLFNLTVSGGISFPSVAQPMWVVAGLALNATAVPANPTGAQNWFGKVLPVPILAAACLLYLVLVLLPVNRCSQYFRAAQLNYPYWQKMDADWRRSLKEDFNSQERLRITAENTGFAKNVVRLLRNAHDYDPANVVPIIDLALWVGELWKLNPNIPLQDQALRIADAATKLDPESSDPYYARYQLNILFAQFTTDATRKREFWSLAAKAFAEVVQRNPQNPKIRYHYADILFLAENMVRGREEAGEALRLDQSTMEPTRRLTQPQRVQARKWSEGSSNG